MLAVASTLALACGEGEPVVSPEALSFVHGEGLEFTEPDLAASPGGELALVFLAFDGVRDRVMASLNDGGAWSEPVPVSPEGAAHFAPRVAADPSGGFLVVWSAWDGAQADVFAARLVGRRVESLEQISAGPGPAVAPCAAVGPDGSLWVAWQARRGGRFDVLARRRQAGRFGPEILVSDDPESDIQPALGIGRDGAVWAAWTSWRDGHYADGNYEIYARRLDPPSEPRRVSTSPGSDMLPAFAQLSEGLALVWTESTFGPIAIADIAAVAYDRWADKSYQVVRIDGDQVGTPQEVRPSPDQATGSGVSVQAVPLRGISGDQLWLLFGNRVAQGPFAFDSRWQLRLARTSPDDVSAPADLSAGVSSLVARYAGTWSGDALWVVDEIEQRFPAETDPLRSALRVRRLAPDQLPARVPLPPLPRKPRRPVNPTLALDRAPGERATVQHDGISWRAFYGNLHLHSDFSGDLRGFEGRPEDNFQALEDIPRLDFGALSDHAETMRPVDWWATRKLTELWNRPGGFVTLPGYEWTSLEYGHRVVLFPDEQVGDASALLAAAPGATPTALWKHLGSRAAITIPHHLSHALMHPVDWSFGDDRFQRLVEIFQSRGSYEFDGAPVLKTLAAFVPGHSVRDALAIGHRLGIIASPDHGGGLGLAGVWARDLSREALFEALYARRTFGTTGAKMDLFMTVAGAPQGSEIRRSEAGVRIEATVRGTAPGLELTIVRDGAEVKQRGFEGSQARWSWTDDDRRPGPRYYYLRARQSDGHMGWTSPVWLDP